MATINPKPDDDGFREWKTARDRRRADGEPVAQYDSLDEMLAMWRRCNKEDQLEFLRRVVIR